MKIITYSILILVCLCACSNKQTNKKISSPKFYIEKIWAKDSPSYSKFEILQEKAEWGNGRRLLSENQVYRKITPIDLKYGDSLLVDFLSDKKLIDKVVNKNNILKLYFRQYFCYESNKDVMLLVNLYAYETKRYDAHTATVFASNPRKIVINPLKGNNKFYMLVLINLSNKAVEFYICAE